MIKDNRGTALVEMAIALPVLLTLIMGIVSYGDWFYTAHNIQQAANEAARSAIGGLTSKERQSLAIESAQTIMRRAGIVEDAATTFLVADDGTTFVMRIRHDASYDPLLRLSFVVSPSTIIQRAAAVRLDSM